jgi:long-chain acyl-CoA synthetase
MQNVGSRDQKTSSSGSDLEKQNEWRPHSVISGSDHRHRYEVSKPVPKPAKRDAPFSATLNTSTYRRILFKAGAKPRFAGRARQMTIRTLNELFYSIVERNLDRAMLYKREQQWVPISSREIYRNVVGVARTLESWGIGKGDRVAILSENRPEWAISDYAALSLGAATVPIYATLTPEQTLHILRDSGAKIIFVSSQEQLKKITSIQSQCGLEKIVVMDEVTAPDVVQMAPIMASGPQGRDEAFDARALAITADDLATIIYTSGTTGTPKGAMLSHGNLASNLLYSLDGYDSTPGRISISFLPLSHVTARHVDYTLLWHGITLAYCPFHEQLLEALAEVRPHFFVAVPRVYEKIYTKVQTSAQEGIKRQIYDWAIQVGRAHKDEVLAGKKPTDLQWRLADKVFYSKVKAALGGRVKVFISGGAPLSRDTLDWYASMGMRINEGYGLTETSPVIALNSPEHFRPGSVGRILKNVQVRIAEDGEILVSGPSVFKGYWNMPVETANVFEGDWFHTGDVGHLDEDGFLFITDRKKDLIKTSGGKFIAPQPIEGKLKANALVAEAAVIADRRKFASAVIAPNFDALEYWARQNRVTFATRQDLVANAQVFALFEDVIADVNRNLAQFEKIKKFIVVADEFSIANNALTPTMKLKRRFIEERYRRQVDELYEADSQAALKAG